ncbi:hypothetical protein [Ruegeria sp. HKCCA4812]|jgi:hypothetical protein|uniref:hypothetical protein n=1 Tax=Ruegeria sp. HKCCA4812 TaxID=2682993 RepID=UPI001488646E|nr:hypothetical protein [Ruegeria sp. HKCCA4812]
MTMAARARADKKTTGFPLQRGAIPLSLNVPVNLSTSWHRCNRDLPGKGEQVGGHSCLPINQKNADKQPLVFSNREDLLKLPGSDLIGAPPFFGCCVRKIRVIEIQNPLAHQTRRV